MKKRLPIVGAASLAVSALIAGALVLPPIAAHADEASAPTGLTINAAQRPLNVESTPHFSWLSPVKQQAAYQIQVGTAPGAADVWDSGKVSSSSNSYVTLPSAQHSQEEYFWRVKVWDASDKESAWSEDGYWEAGLLGGESDWDGSEWIGGRLGEDNNWKDSTVSVNFTGGATPTKGLEILTRAEPYGKTWGEGLSWIVRQSATGGIELVMAAKHYAGNYNSSGVWTDAEAVQPQWGVNHYDPQSTTNPTATGSRTVAIATVPVPAGTGLTPETWATGTHKVEIALEGLTVTTRVNGTVVDERELTGQQIRRQGTIGFGASSSAIVKSVSVASEDGNDFSVNLRNGKNPFESGIGTKDGLTFVAKNAMLPIANPAPILRKATELPQGEIADARLYLSAAGYADFTVNGTELTVDGEAPNDGGTNVARLITDQTSYDQKIYYDAFDVTKFVKPGTNVLATELGRGWYGVTTPQEWYWQLAPYAGDPRFRSKLVVTYADGTSHTVNSDSSWQTADGPTTFDSVYSGEKFDAGKASALGQWRTKSSVSGSAWQEAPVLLEPGSCVDDQPSCHGALPNQARPDGFKAARVVAHEAETVQVNQTLSPVSIRETAPGSKVYVVDFGQILTGFPKLSLDGITTAGAGKTIRLRGGNSITGAGTAEAPLVVAEENNFHDANLQTNYYTAANKARQSWEPRLSHWGFRYMEVRGIEEVIGHVPTLNRDPGLFSVNVARTGFDRIGSFDTDNALINRINSNLEWSQQNNYVGKPTDTPSREKNGWTGDTLADSETQGLIWNLEAAHREYLRGFGDAQVSSGHIPMILPAAKGGYGYDKTPGWTSTHKAVPAWDSALFIMPWELYEYSGDSALFAELYDTQDKVLKYYETLFLPENDYKFPAALGAYSGAEPGGSHAVISLQFYIHFADYMAKVGTLIGADDRAAYYADKAKTLRAAFLANYWDEASETYLGGSVSSQNAMAIEFDLVPGSDRDPSDPLYLEDTGTVAENETRLAKLLADRIVAANYHIQSDMYGSRYEFNILSEYGYSDVLLKAITQNGDPGYVSQIAQGATSLWERWNGGSLNHHYRSNVATWFYQSLAGIQPTGVAYESIRIRPYIPTVAVNASLPTSTTDASMLQDDLGRASASLETARGTVSSSWNKNDNGSVTLSIVAPNNASTEVWVPTLGKSATGPASATFVRDDSSGGADYKVYEVSAGSFEFTGGVDVAEPTVDPQITGTPSVGKTLTVSPGEWSPEPSSFEYQWTRNGEAIEGATASSYRLVAADSGKDIAASVTAVIDGQSRSSVTAESVRVGGGALALVTAPKISGTAKVGKTVTASAGTWSQKVTVKYQWKSNGKAIAGATKSRYTLKAPSAGKSLSVSVTASAPGYSSKVATSATVKVKKGTISLLSKPAITGKAKAGGTLRVSKGKWSETSVSTSYQWYVGAKKIAGATKKSLSVAKKFTGKKLSAKVTVTKRGFAQASVKTTKVVIKG